MQVAVLVPTTLLASQHGNTFADRFAGYPIRVEVLSRFLTNAEANKVIKGLESGEVDCVIGTHRLLSNGIKFKNLGLLIVDEEQRFGVQHKEAMKLLKNDVDVLTLTATPIPRTLEMSLVGIRDLSLLQTPRQIASQFLLLLENTMSVSLSNQFAVNYYAKVRCSGSTTASNRSRNVLRDCANSYQKHVSPSLTDKWMKEPLNK